MALVTILCNVCMCVGDGDGDGDDEMSEFPLPASLYFIVMIIVRE